MYGNLLDIMELLHLICQRTAIIAIQVVLYKAVIFALSFILSISSLRLYFHSPSTGISREKTWTVSRLPTSFSLIIHLLYIKYDLHKTIHCSERKKENTVEQQCSWISSTKLFYLLGYKLITSWQYIEHSGDNV